MVVRRKEVHFKHTYGDLCAEVLLGSSWHCRAFSCHAAVMERQRLGESCIVCLVREVDYIKLSGKRWLQISIVWEAERCFSQNTCLSWKTERYQHLKSGTGKKVSVWFLGLCKQHMGTGLLLQPRKSRLLWSFPGGAGWGREPASVWTHANANIVRYFMKRSQQTHLLGGHE